MLKLRSQITRKILNYFFLNPEKENYINELARDLALDPGNLFRKLKELEQEGILLAENKGHQKYFHLNSKYPLLGEMKRTFELKYGLPEILKTKLAALSGLEEAYIFGSYAKNTLQMESDIDLLLVGRHSTREAKRTLLQTQKEIQREINIIDLSPEEFRQRQKQEDEFIKNIFSDKFIKLL